MSRGTLSWQASALCAQADPDFWFLAPQEGGKYTEAKAFCRRCPVRTECADYALAGEWGLPATERRGVWAGMSPVDRVKAERKVRAARAKARQAA